MTKNASPPARQQIEIDLPDEVAEGLYINLALVAHSESDFIIDFARLVPGKKKARVQCRVIMSPQHVRRLIRALEDNAKKYEEQFGKIAVKETERAIGFVKPGDE